MRGSVAVSPEVCQGNPGKNYIGVRSTRCSRTRLRLFGSTRYISPHKLQPPSYFIQLFLRCWPKPHTRHRSRRYYGSARISDEIGCNTAMFGCLLESPQFISACTLQDYFWHTVRQPQPLSLLTGGKKRRYGCVSHLRREFSSGQFKRLVHNDNLFHVPCSSLLFAFDSYASPGIA